MITRKKSIIASCMGALSVSGATATFAQDQSFAIEEVIVTAQRRSQSIQDVANSVEALSGSDLDSLGKVNFEDYIGSIGGAGFTKSGSGSVKIGLRGVSATSQSEYGVAEGVSTVGVYLDNVAIQGSGTLPDLNLYDLERIEVLKGPQGTLYGDGAMGGAIKMVLNRPDLWEFSAKGEVSVMGIDNADLGQRIRGAVNIPVIDDSLAVRIVGSYSDQKGWIDNIATGEDGVNDTESWSVRALALAQISDAFSAELLLMHDQQNMDDFPQTVIGLGDNETNLTVEQFNDVETQIYALTLIYDLGFAELTSVTSQFEKDRAFNALFPAFSFLVDPNQTNGLGEEEETFSQEIRLVSTGNSVLDYTAGIFYRDRQRDLCGTFDVAPSPFFPPRPPTTTTCAVKPPSGFDFRPREAEEVYEQLAVYGEVNYALTDAVDLTVGARWFEEDVTFSESTEGFGIFAIFPPSDVSGESSEDDVLFKVGLSWAATDDQLYYFNVAEGFRSGAPNLNAGVLVVPGESEEFALFESDSLINYELGAKTAWYDGRFILNGALFYSDWSDIQTVIFRPSTAVVSQVVVPGGDAEIKGAEFAASLLATESFTTGLTVAYQEAEYTHINDRVNIREGSAIPNAPELTASFYLQYARQYEIGEFFARADYRFVDEQRTEAELGDPTQPGIPADYAPGNQVLPSYEVVNISAGLRADSWYVTGYINNAFNEDYALNYGYATFRDDSPTGSSIPTLESVGAPRTIGVTLGVDF